jgi:hypothetical protein
VTQVDHIEIRGEYDQMIKRSDDQNNDQEATIEE